MEPKDFAKLMFVLTVVGVVLYLSSSIDFGKDNMIDLPTDMITDADRVSGRVSDIGKISVRDIEGQEDFPTIPDRPDESENSDVQVLNFDNPIDPSLTDKEVCILYLNNGTNSCGNFYGGGSSYSMSSSSSSSYTEPEEAVIPEFSTAMIPLFVCLMGLYMRRLQGI